MKANQDGVDGSDGGCCWLGGEGRTNLLRLELNERDPAMQTPAGRGFPAKGITSAKARRQAQTRQMKRWVIASREVERGPR